MMIRPVLVPIPPPAAGDGLPAATAGARLRTPERVAQQRAYARLALRECARLSGAPLEGWKKGRDEAPVPLARCGLHGEPDGLYHWSVSHKRHWAAAVIADHLVGIDVEYIVPRRESLFEALASESEWTVMGGRSWASFYRLWTAKEATLKANGVGVGELRACRLVEVASEHRLTVEYTPPVRSDPHAANSALSFSTGCAHWSIEHFYIADHVAAVTCGTVPVSWCVLDS
ncbi:MAG: 4'-phosphopantetheinyl transferase family protein [Phycisphaerae bacterium]